MVNLCLPKIGETLIVIIEVVGIIDRSRVSTGVLDLPIAKHDMKVLW